jgi:hypothetical protein
MAKFIIMGKYTAKGLGGFVSNPNTDRKAATTALCESVGAKLKGYAGLRGEYDFMVEVEGTFEFCANRFTKCSCCSFTICVRITYKSSKTFCGIFSHNYKFSHDHLL